MKTLSLTIAIGGAIWFFAGARNYVAGSGPAFTGSAGALARTAPQARSGLFESDQFSRFALSADEGVRVPSRMSPLPAQRQSANNKSQQRPSVTAAQINGVYRDGRNDFRVLALGHHKLKVQFNGEWMTRGGYPNIGEAIGEADIQGNVATFIPGETTKCKITLTFLRNRMEVVQEGLDADCGFGHNVMATGTYRRIKAGRPKFIPIPR